MRAVIWFVAVCLVAVGCTPGQPDSHPPTGSSSGPSSPAPLTRTLDPSAFETEGTVCDLLTDAQAAEFGLQSQSKPHKQTDAVLECQRARRGTDQWQIEYDLYLNTDILDYWSGDDDLRYRVIEGQPAGVEDWGGGVCKVGVLLAKRKSLHVLVTELHRDDGCSLAIPMAEQIVRNLVGAG